MPGQAEKRERERFLDRSSKRDLLGMYIWCYIQCIADQCADVVVIREDDEC